MLVSVYGISIADSFRDGAWSARHVYDACEPAPSKDELIAERVGTLREEWPTATPEALANFAEVWAEGWLAVAHRARLLWLAEHK